MRSSIDQRVELESGIVLRRARELRPELSATMRLVRRVVGAVVYYEPFVDGGSASAVYAARKSRRYDLENDMVSVCVALLESGGRVLFVRQSENDSLPSALPHPSSRKTLHEILESVHRGNFGYWEIDLGQLLFRFSGVEVRLLAPLEVDGSENVGGFFASYEVAAVSVDAAVESLHRAIAEDGGWVVKSPPPQMVSTAALPFECRRIGGRTFYALS